MELSRLAELAAVQDVALDRIDVSGTRRVALEERRAPRRARALQLCAAAALAVAVALVWGAWRLCAPLDFAMDGRALGADTEWAVPVATSHELTFSDGSRFTLSGGTRVRVRDITADGAELVVVSGRVWAQVEHLPGARWSVKLGPYTVRVTGTVFGATWDPEQHHLRVELVEGGVTVVGPDLGTGLSLRPGEHMAVSDRNGLVLGRTTPRASASSVKSATPPAPPASTASASPIPAPTTSASASPAAPAAPSWRMLARAKKHQEAFAETQRMGWDGLLERSSAAELVELADLARFAGQGAASERAWLALRTRFPDHAASPRAAFLLGRARFMSRSGDWGASWFSTYLAEAGSGPLASEAAGRLIEAHRGAGNDAAARAAAESYLRAFPSGPHAALAHRLLGEDP